MSIRPYIYAAVCTVCGGELECVRRRELGRFFGRWLDRYPNTRLTLRIEACTDQQPLGDSGHDLA